MNDIYQDRYLEHIENKLKRKQIKHSYNDKARGILDEILLNRKSVRRFNNNTIDDSILSIIKYALKVSPSSCNRHGIYFEEVTPEYAEQVLVGGKNWVKNANRVFFFYGAKECYKNPKEISYMPFLDAGFPAMIIYLLCEVNGIGCCFINPNLKEELENKDYFVGAIAIGDYDV